MAQQLDVTEKASGMLPMGRPSISTLQPKGSCWYCDAPVDAVRRFCCTTCRNDFLEEEASYFVANSAAGGASA